MPIDPFHAIIGEANPGQQALVLVAGEFDKGVPPYHVETQRTVPRAAGALAQCANLLLRTCDEIQIVDAHFDPAEPRFVDTFKAILAIRNAAPQPLKLLEIHTEKKPTFDRANREHHLRRALQDAIPKGIILRAHFWSCRPGGENLHPRFLLTELGGIQFDYGLDAGEVGETTIVTLMDHTLWQKVRADFTVPSPCFDITPDCVIAIRGRA